MNKTQLRKRVEDLLTEYIDESEHQEGMSYWKMFDSLQDAVADFLLYAKIVNEDDQKRKGQ